MAKMVTRTSHKVTLYIRNHSGYIYERLLRTYSTIWYSGHQNVQTYQRPDSAADRLPTATPPRPSCSLSYTPIRDPFSRSNPKKKSLWWPKQNLYWYRPVKMERIKRNVCGTKQIVRRYKVHSSCGCFYQPALYRMPWGRKCNEGFSGTTCKTRHFVPSLQIILTLRDRSREPPTNSVIFKTKTEFKEGNVC